MVRPLIAGIDRDLSLPPNTMPIVVSAIACIMILLSAIAVATDYFYFNDSAFFYFAMVSDIAPEAVWQQYPQRVAALVLTQGPAIILLKSGLDVGTAKQIYATTFLALPVLALALASYLNSAFGSVTASAMMICVLGFTSFGFPTEATVALSMFVVLLSAITTTRRSRIRIIILSCIPPVFLLTHEIAFLLMLGLLVRAYHDHKSGQLGRELWCTLIGGFFISLLGWIYLYHTVVPTNLLIVKALQQNAESVFAFRYTLLRPLACLALVSIGGFFLISVLPNASHRNRALVAILALLLGVFITSWWRDLANDRYNARVVMIWLAPLLVFLPSRLRSRPVEALIILGISSILIAAIHVKSISDWTQFRGAFVAKVQGRARPPDLTASRLAALEIRFNWAWAFPFQAAIMTERGSRATLPLYEPNLFVPVTCDVVRAKGATMQILLTEVEYERLATYVCARSNPS